MRKILPLLALAFMCGCDNLNFWNTTDDATLGSMTTLSSEDALRPPRDRSRIMILTKPPVHILAIAPDSLRAGYDPVTGQDLTEIAESYYFLETILGNTAMDAVEQNVLEIHNPESGTYEIQLASNYPGTSYFSVQACNQAGVPTEALYLTEFGSDKGPQNFVLHFDKGIDGASKIVRIEPVGTAGVTSD